MLRESDGSSRLFVTSHAGGWGMERWIGVVGARTLGLALSWDGGTRRGGCGVGGVRV